MIPSALRWQGSGPRAMARAGTLRCCPLERRRLALTPAAPLLALRPRRLLAQPHRLLHCPDDGRAILLHIADRAAQPVRKYSLAELLQLQELPLRERLQVVENFIHTGISKIIILLQDLPLGLGSVKAIRGVIQDYIQDIKDLRSCSAADDPERFLQCVAIIHERHRRMNSLLADGLVEFQKNIHEGFGPVAELSETDCLQVFEVVAGLRKIEVTLDEFFTIRTTNRLLISHCIELHQQEHVATAYGDDSFSRNGAAHEESRTFQARRVGAVTLDTNPALVLMEAYQHAQFKCRREFDVASSLLINGVHFQEFFSHVKTQGGDSLLPYVEGHLYFTMYEILYCAIMMSIRKVGPGKTPPPIKVQLDGPKGGIEDPGGGFSGHSVKISDAGVGIRREDLEKVWSYFYPLASDPDDVNYLRLPVSRVLIRYHGGDIGVQSVHRKGTDVYVYL